MNIKSIGILGLLLVLCAFMAVMTSDPWYDIFSGTFLQANNVENLLRRTAMYGVLGIGVAFVIITSGIDLSIGSVVCLSGCLLATFLQVEYRSVGSRDVLQVSAKQKTIVFRGPPDSFAPGDRLRFWGGRRARNAIVRVERIEPAGSAEFPESSRMVVDQEFSRDDDGGQVARVFSIQRFTNRTADSPSTITLPITDHPLRPRDQVTLVHPTQLLKQAVITQVTVDDTSMVLALKEDLGRDFNDQWLAVPLERRQRMSIAAALALVLSIAAGLGLIHGLLVTRIRLRPFVVTLCGLLIYRGASRWLVSDQPVGFRDEYTDSLSALGSGKWSLFEWMENGHTHTFGIPYPFFIMVIAAIVAAIFLNKTIWGRYLLALGRNEEATRYSGINTSLVTMIAYVICTVSAAVGGMLFALDSNSVSPSSFGNFFELYAIAAAVLGGCSLRGGEGTILGVIIGTMVMQILNNLILLMKISDELEFAIIGAVILVGVSADEIVRQLAARRRALADARLAATAAGADPER